MDENYRHCEALVRSADKDRFLATLFAPADKRGPLFGLYAFNVEIASVRQRAREPMPGEIRLQWWRDVINGERAGEAAANPIAAALIEIIARFSLPKARLVDLLEAHAFDLYDDPMPTFEALEGYVRQTSAAILDLAARICGAHVEHASERGGLAYGITTLLRTFALNASRRQLFVPLEALLPQLPAAPMPAFLPVALVPGHLSAMEELGYEPFKPAAEVPQWRRQWVLWRAARQWSRVMQR